MSESVDLDFSYLKVMVDESVIDNPTHSTGQHLKGKIDADVNLISVGATKRF